LTSISDLTGQDGLKIIRKERTKELAFENKPFGISDAGELNILIF